MQRPSRHPFTPLRILWTQIRCNLTITFLVPPFICADRFASGALTGQCHHATTGRRGVKEFGNLEMAFHQQILSAKRQRTLGSLAVPINVDEEEEDITDILTQPCEKEDRMTEEQRVAIRAKVPKFFLVNTATFCPLSWHAGACPCSNSRSARMRPAKCGTRQPGRGS